MSRHCTHFGSCVHITSKTDASPKQHGLCLRHLSGRLSDRLRKLVTTGPLLTLPGAVWAGADLTACTARCS